MRMIALCLQIQKHEIQTAFGQQVQEINIFVSVERILGSF